VSSSVYENRPDELFRIRELAEPWRIPDPKGRVAFSRCQNFIPHKVQTNDLRHGSRNAVAEVTVDGVLHHGAKLFKRVALRDDAVPQRGGDISAIGFVLLNFENDLAHGARLTAWAPSGKSRVVRERIVVIDDEEH
jgi:hypothetical protein